MSEQSDTEALCRKLEESSLPIEIAVVIGDKLRELSALTAQLATYKKIITAEDQAIVDDVQRLEAQLAEANQRFLEEKEIVDRIWAMFGNPSYESLKGRSIYDLISEARKDAEINVPQQFLDEAAAIYELMLRCSTSCKPMHHLLTTDGLYSLNIANLHVRDNGINYIMEADWAKQCGKLVKALTEIRNGTYVQPQASVTDIHQSDAAIQESKK